MKVGAVAYRARGRGEFESAFEEMVKARVNAVVMIDDTVISTNLPALAELAARHRLPALASPEYVDVGGWIGYGVNIPAQFRRSAYFVDRIFKGARPADLPIQQPTNFELAVNRAASRTLGIPLPQALLVRADRVVEQ
jgi:putative ABC transport system substrate-binding protein